ncbi:hypothetical protein P168DRAFT_301174 [Aspergillus campestris IBT 28561]|uniref:Uncharacterized protein n=1 Tax=Aspergillus campestris (strain IBT 28561) TaxID=1392248 RepID=A0A2I1DF39_ASPC2|nr:uncharacterized protein P168DRAFT_301174 [Aspergillus campestris IBT 28561]PKY08484.1 hypothetical protein P168DRAFT_301174 [Aspergillus campestris IBT 28561]
MPLTPNTLYIALYLRTDPPTPNNYHWALYLHNPNPTSKIQGSTKYHIVNSNPSSTWVASHGPESGILKTFLLAGLTRIGEIPDNPAVLAKTDEVIRSFDGQLNEMDVTCRTWLVRVLEVLQREVGVPRYRDGKDAGDLEREVLGFGNEVAGEAARNVQPRPVVESVWSLCMGFLLDAW